ncbi:hypothetical protein RJ640_007081 [Escallonia rubra]|uniref:Transposase (putative) gypsy type domain-containing protein n=1 Tax=Escallonia rubra TaxID=112253 RepID=A0AA88R0E8_9ASTE|nr:hypothetical protein RJ640_007081 [Escallonia rubra]
MSVKDMSALIQEYPIPEGWYARVPGLQEPANYGTKFETMIYDEQVKSGYRLPLHHFALSLFKHYHMALGQLVPNGWRKLIGLIYLVETSGYKPDSTDFMRVFFKICFVKGIANCPGWYYIHSRQRLLKGGPKSSKGWHSRYFFVGRQDKGDLPFDRDWNPYCKDFENPGKPTLNNLTKHILSHINLRGGLSIDEPFTEQQLEWTLRHDDMGMPDSHISEQHLLHGVLPRDNEIFQNQTHESFASSFVQAVYTEVDEATYCAEELRKQEADYIAHIEAHDMRLEPAKRKAAEEAKKSCLHLGRQLCLRRQGMPQLLIPQRKALSDDVLEP